MDTSIQETLDKTSELPGVSETTEARTVTTDVQLRRKGTDQCNGRHFSRCFTTKDRHPFEAVEWELRECSITNDRGELVFRQHEVEAPSFWSQMATNVVASKYLYGEPGTPERETGIRRLIQRVVTTIAGWGRKDGYFAAEEDAHTFEDELTHILLHQYAAFNSPVWFNVGVQEKPQCSACFIVSVDDTMDSLLDLQKTEGRLFKFGSGTGSNLSTIRSSKEKLAGGGAPSGPVSFMRGFDAWAGIIKSGGKTRRAAKMQILNITHPDVVEFIRCKQDEEKKAWALIESGYDGSFAAPGGAYESVAFQNANLSVRVTDEFMQAVKNKGKFMTRRVLDDQPCDELDAAEVMQLIAQGTHICGDPGLQFDTIINDWHTCPNSGRINGSNPCSEYMHLDDSACNLASINLLRFLKEDGEFDVAGFRHTVDVLISAQDILIDNSSYPTPKIGKSAVEFRQLGLGYANLGAVLMNLGLPYDSDEGREWAAAVTAVMTGQAYATSAVLARSLKPFIGYKRNRKEMLRVIKKHADAVEQIECRYIEESLLDEARKAWHEALNIGTKYGYRNSQATVLAPTGTISFMMDCDTTGVEPDLGLVKYKKLSDGGLLKIVNRSVPNGLRKLGYAEEEIQEIVRYIEVNDMIEGAPYLKEEHLAVFDCAFKPVGGKRSIHYMGHLKMMGAVQPFISGAISKTVNLPKDTSVEEIFNTYMTAWELGVKAVALYRDGSKRTQPLSAGKDVKEKEAGEVRKPVRKRLPDERQAITHKFSVGGLEGYLTVGLFEDGTPGEIFMVVAKEGSTLSGMMDAFATSISLALQYGVPLLDLVRKFSHMRFEPSGFTHNKEIAMANSVVDYVFKWMALKFLSTEERMSLGLKVMDGEIQKRELPVKKALANGVKSNGNGTNGSAKRAATAGSDEKTLMMSTFENSVDAPPCTNCGASMLVRQAGCYVCLNCGSQGGCG
jgi:ribonucleoside-diphosphate reductase alpha chain